MADVVDNSERPKLRVGILANGTSLARWQALVLDQLTTGGDVEIAALVIDDSPRGTPSTRQRLDRLASDRALWRMYNTFWVRRRARAIERVDCAQMFRDATVIRVVPQRVGRWSQHLSDEDLGELRALDLDVLLRFGFGILRGDVLDVARYGIWSFHHDDERVIRGGPPSFWEVADELPATGVLLQRLTEHLDAGVPLARATFRTVGHSYPRNRDQAALGAAPLVATVARAVRHGWLRVDQLAPAASDAAIRRDPTNLQMLGFATRQLKRALRARVKGVMVGARWGVAIGPMPEISQPVSLPPMEWLPERPGGYYADPFPASRGGQDVVFVEEFDERSGAGVISALRRSGDGWHVVSDVLGADGHTSYPYLLEVDSDLFCIPESAQAGAVRAWRCDRFPDRWDEHGVLLDEPVVDPTVFAHGGRWWLFGTMRGHGSNTALHAWSAPSWDGPYTPHPLNPIKIDVTGSRPAGTPFCVDGTLYRPAQDCSEGYGRAVVLNRINRLDATTFEEERIGLLDVDCPAYGTGNHTLSFRSGFVAVDGKRDVRNWHRSRRELVARVRLVYRR